MGNPADWLRVVMDAEIKAWVQYLNPSALDAFEISGHKWERLGFKSYKNAKFPEFDICQKPPHGEFDIIIADQVWEHLKYPYRAAQNVLKSLRPGGYFAVTVPFLVKLHPAPSDCTRWSAEGLKYFLEECGFDPNSIQANQWGNKACLIANLDKWIHYDSSRDLTNEELYPISVWALARKIN